MDSRSRFQAFVDAAREMPRAALVVVLVGLVVTVLVGVVSLFGDGVAATVPWETTEPVTSVGPAAIGPAASISLERGLVSTTAQTTRGDFLYRVSGLVRVESRKSGPFSVECEVESLSPGSQVARTIRKRASWPRPSDDLARQVVPDLASLRFQTKGATYADVSLRDAINAYTDSVRPTLTEWPGYLEDRESWIWTFPEGPGAGTVSLGYIVMFKTSSRPRGRVTCRARSEKASGRLSTSFRQQEWPLASVDIDAAQSSQQSDVE